MIRSSKLIVLAGAIVSVTIGLVGAGMRDQVLAARLEAKAEAVIAETNGAPVKASFRTRQGFPTRHPVLSGGEGLSDPIRAKVAHAVAAIPGVGGVNWIDGAFFSRGEAETMRPISCQDDVQALLRARTIRFEEGSSRIDRASAQLVDEVADALAPCLGSIIAITGHTDNSGPEPGNLALSRERAESVRRALIRRGIPADGLRTSGVGSSHPVEGLEPGDPANRRIEFSVLETVPIKPTPVDTPGAH